MSACLCGCGLPAPIATANRPHRGQVKGQPLRFVKGHNGRRPIAERLWEKVRKTDTCWLWTSSLDGDGYGRIRVGASKRPAHCVSYELLVGPIPTGLQLDHLCRVRNCVNPAHLEAVTQRVNILRGEGAAAKAMRAKAGKASAA